MRFRWPLKNPVVTAEWGWKPSKGSVVDKIYKRIGLKAHNGVDLVDNKDKTVRAEFPGRISKIENHPTGFGWHVKQSHDYWYKTPGKKAKPVESVVAHLKPGSIKVKVGQRVKKGTTIGIMGKSGIVTGEHVHQGFRYIGAPQDDGYFGYNLRPSLVIKAWSDREAKKKPKPKPKPPVDPCAKYKKLIEFLEKALKDADAEVRKQTNLKNDLGGKLQVCTNERANLKVAVEGLQEKLEKSEKQNQPLKEEISKLRHNNKLLNEECDNITVDRNRWQTKYQRLLADMKAGKLDLAKKVLILTITLLRQLVAATKPKKTKVKK